jgi:hypothetical protein
MLNVFMDNGLNYHYLFNRALFTWQTRQSAQVDNLHPELIQIVPVMSLAKNKLKLARDALNKKDYAQARNAASQVLEYEPDNYNA